MLENLAYLHYGYIYEQGEEGSAICLKPGQGWVTLPLAICTWLASPQSAEAVSALEYGASGKAIVSLQNQLKQASCLPQENPINGEYNKATYAAVTSFQQQNNLLVDGIVGNETYAALAKKQTCNASGEGLKLGNQGEEVRLMQIQLNNWGFPLDPQKPRLKPSGKFDPATQEALQEFKKFFGLGYSDSPKVSEILWKPRATALVEYLNHYSFQWIAPALENLEPTEKPEAIVTILSILESSGTYKHRTPAPDAAAALGILRADATTTVPRLLTLLRDRQNVRANAARALGYIGVDANQVIPALTAVATNKNEERYIRHAAVEAIGGFEADAVEPLLGILKNPTEDHHLRVIAAEALGYIGVDANQVIPALTAVATNKNENLGLRHDAVEAIGEFGADAKDAVEPLVEILKDPNENFNLHNVVIEALGKMGSTAQAAIPTLMVLLDDQNYTALGLKNNFQRQTLNAKLNETTIKPTSFSEQAALALAGIGSAAAPELIAALQNPDEKMRYSAVFALGRMQPPALSAVEALEALMNNPNENPNIRWMAASALETMGQDTQRFFSQSSRQSLDTLEKQKCPAREVFREYVGECVGRFGEGGGREIAQRFREGRRKKRR